MLALLRGATLAACVGALSAGAAHAQQMERKEAPLLGQNLWQMWESQQSQMRARISEALQQLKGACGQELRNFCGTVTPGEGRMLLCMQAHEDKLGRPCEMALLDVSRGIGHAVRSMERFAEACWSDIKAHCSTPGASVDKCMVDNMASLSPPCRAIVAAEQAKAGQSRMQQAGRPSQPPTMTGLAVYSTDGMKLGEVTGIKRRPDGSVEAIQAQIGSPLGLGSSDVLISPGDLRWKGDHIELQMVADQVRSILRGQKR